MTMRNASLRIGHPVSPGRRFDALVPHLGGGERVATAPPSLRTPAPLASSLHGRAHDFDFLIATGRRTSDRLPDASSAGERVGDL